jgi:hypothetical protein
LDLLTVWAAGAILVNVLALLIWVTVVIRRR